jgi:2-isopropylmalate synthase
MSDEMITPESEHYQLVSSMFHSETGEAPLARLTISVDGEEQEAQATGSGPVDATFKAIESVAASGSELLLYSVTAITTGTDAQGEVTVRLAKDGRIVNGQGADTDIVVASAKAYIHALNTLYSRQEKLNPQV